MAATLDELSAADLPAARELLAEACRHDRAADVAEEKLLGASPRGLPTALAARDGGALVGVASVSGDRIRLLAVAPHARQRGVGSMLLAACERVVWAGAHRRARALDEPGNYLAPGVDVDNHDTLTWLARRGYVCRDEHENLVVDVRTNPRVTAARAAELADRCAAHGYQIRRARLDELDALSAAISIGFGARGRSSASGRRPGSRAACTWRCTTAASPPSPRTTATTAAWAGSDRPAPGPSTAARGSARRC